jgi:hypothetical protein
MMMRFIVLFSPIIHRNYKVGCVVGNIKNLLVQDSEGVIQGISIGVVWGVF